MEQLSHQNVGVAAYSQLEPTPTRKFCSCHFCAQVDDDGNKSLPLWPYSYTSTHYMRNKPHHPSARTSLFPLFIQESGFLMETQLSPMTNYSLQIFSSRCKQKWFLLAFDSAFVHV